MDMDNAIARCAVAVAGVVISVPAVLWVLVTICVRSMVSVIMVFGHGAHTGRGLIAEPKAMPKTNATRKAAAIVALYLRSFDATEVGLGGAADGNEGAGVWSLRPHSRQNWASAAASFPHRSQNGVAATSAQYCLYPRISHFPHLNL
jgi:hypothetical protein